MASQKEFIEYICGQMDGAGTITYKKMFGDYALYCNSICFALVCDDILYITPTPAGLALCGESQEMGVPYPGAKPRIMLEDVEDRDFLSLLVSTTCQELVKKRK